MDDQDRYFKLRAPPDTPPDEICHCEGNKPIKLMTALGFNPLHCIDCNLEINPESLVLADLQIEALAYWNQLYDAIFRLWLDSAEYEDWAREQLLDVNSPVNRRGLALSQELSAVRRCYFWYFQDESVDDVKPLTHCPKCHGPFTLYSSGIFPQLICESCGIIAFGE